MALDSSLESPLALEAVLFSSRPQDKSVGV